METLIRRCILQHLIWVCTVCQLAFYRSPDYNGLILCLNPQSTKQNCSRLHASFFYVFFRAKYDMAFLFMKTTTTNIRYNYKSPQSGKNYSEMPESHYHPNLWSNNIHEFFTKHHYLWSNIHEFFTKHYCLLRGMDIPSREALCLSIYSLLEKMSILKEKNLLLLEDTHFRKGLECKKTNRKSQKLCPL